MYREAFLTLLLCGCMPIHHEALSELAGSTWQLEQFQSPDDSIGLLTPAQDSQVQMRFDRDAHLSVKLPCRQSEGTWQTGGHDPKSDSLSITIQPHSSATCEHEALSRQVERDLAFVRSFTLDGDRLHMSLFADGGIYTWKKVSTAR